MPYLLVAIWCSSIVLQVSLSLNFWGLLFLYGGGVGLCLDFGLYTTHLLSSSICVACVILRAQLLMGHPSTTLV